MAQIIFRNLISSKACTDKECAVFSYIVCKGEPVTDFEIGLAFPSMRMKTIQTMLETFYARAWLDLEESVADDGTPSYKATIDENVVRTILVRNHESIEDDLGDKVAVIKRILGVEDKKEAPAPAPTPAPVETVTIEPEPVKEPEPELAVVPVPPVPPTESNLTAEGEVNLPSFDADGCYTRCSDDPAVQKLFEKNRQETIERRQRRQFSVPTKERIIQEGLRYIDAAKDRYPHLADIDMEKAADKFFDFYESKGWMVGKTKMKVWQTALQNALRDWDMPKREKTPEEEFSWLFGKKKEEGEVVDGQYTEEPEKQEEDDWSNYIGPSDYEIEDLRTRYAERRG